MASKSSATGTAIHSPGRKWQSVLLGFVALRVINALVMHSYFQPDEYYQALEPAWQMAFGDQSGAWITWEWQYQLRSSLHPAIFGAVYVLADAVMRLVPFSYVVRPQVLIAAPKIAQGVIAAFGDYFTWQLAVRFFGDESAATMSTLVMTACNPWQWFVSVRTFSNSLETTLTVAALRYWPWELVGETRPVKENPKALSPLSNARTLNRLRISLILAAFAVVLRPTNLLIWLTIAAMSVARPATAVSVMAILLREAVLCGSTVLGISLLSDRLYYGDWTFPPYKWLYFNISQSLAVFYGQSPWHYYLLQGIPLLCTTYLPFVVPGLYSQPPPTATSLQRNATMVLVASVYTMVVTLSCISHKEVRFIYPLLPMLHIIAAPRVAAFFTIPTSPPASVDPSKASPPKLAIIRRPILVAIACTNLVIASYLTFAQQPATLDVMTHLRRAYLEEYPDALANPSFRPDDPLFALFLMPCHSTPWRSHLIYPGLTARALTCEPPLHTAPNSTERRDYRDEADRFYDSVSSFLMSEMWPISADETCTSAPLPKYIVAFAGIQPGLNFYLDLANRANMGWRLDTYWAGWNGWFNEDWRRRGDIVIWKVRKSLERETLSGHGAT